MYNTPQSSNVTKSLNLNKSLEHNKAGILKADPLPADDIFCAVVRVPIDTQDFEYHVMYQDGTDVTLTSKEDLKCTKDNITLYPDFKQSKVFTDPAFQNEKPGVFGFILTETLAQKSQFKAQFEKVDKRKSELMAKAVSSVNTVAIKRIEESSGAFASTVGDKVISWGGMSTLLSNNSKPILDSSISSVKYFGTLLRTKKEWSSDFKETNVNQIMLPGTGTILQTAPFSINKQNFSSDKISCDSCSASFIIESKNEIEQNVILQNNDMILKQSEFKLGANSKLTLNPNNQLIIYFTTDETSCTNYSQTIIVDLDFGNKTFVNGICEIPFYNNTNEEKFLTFDEITTLENAYISNQFNNLKISSTVQGNSPSIKLPNGQVTGIERSVTESIPFIMDFGDTTQLSVTLVNPEVFTFPTGTQIEVDTPITTDSPENLNIFVKGLTTNPAYASLSENGLVVWGKYNQFLFKEFKGVKEFYKLNTNQAPVTKLLVIKENNEVQLATLNNGDSAFSFETLPQKLVLYPNTKIYTSGYNFYAIDSQGILQVFAINPDNLSLTNDSNSNLSIDKSFPKTPEFLSAQGFFVTLNSGILVKININQNIISDYGIGNDFGSIIQSNNKLNSIYIRSKDGNKIYYVDISNAEKLETTELPCKLENANYSIFNLNVDSRNTIFINTKEKTFVIEGNKCSETSESDKSNYRTIIKKDFKIDFSEKWNVKTSLSLPIPKLSLDINTLLFDDNSVKSIISDSNKRETTDASDYKALNYSPMPANLKIKAGTEIIQNGSAFAAIKEDGTIAVWGNTNGGGYLPYEFAQKKVKKIINNRNFGFYAVLE